MLGLIRLPRNILQKIRQLPFAVKKILLLFFILVIYLLLPASITHTPPSVFSDPKLNEAISHASLTKLADVYDRARLELLKYKKFNSTATAENLRSPIILPDGTSNFYPSLSLYIERLSKFIDDYLSNTPEHIQIGAKNAIKDLRRRSPPSSRPNELPPKVWSTHPRGIDGVKDGFNLWKELLHYPLARTLMDELSTRKDLEWLKPARKGQDWEVVVSDDNELDQRMSEWTSESIVRGVKGKGKWSKLWGGLEKGVLRADVFRYVAMFVQGGIYSDSDTMPISHPYLWGLNAPSILNPDIQTLMELMKEASKASSHPDISRINQLAKAELDFDTQHNKTSIADLDTRSYAPPYHSHSLRAPVSVPTNELPTTILNPEISIIIAIEWDSMIGRTLSMWRQWTWWRFNRSWPDHGFPRGLQMVQNLLVSKPFHPIMLDTLTTIAQLVESGIATQLSPLEFTGPGPFTDAVLRYLLVQYGITPEELRTLRGPVRIGDVLILQEEALHAPDKAMQQLLSHFRSIGPKTMKNDVYRKDPWLFGLGWEDWQSGGIKVAYHGLTGIWKGKQR